MGYRYWKIEMLLFRLHNMSSHSVSGSNSRFKWCYTFSFMPFPEILSYHEILALYLCLYVKENIFLPGSKVCWACIWLDVETRTLTFHQWKWHLTFIHHS